MAPFTRRRFLLAGAAAAALPAGILVSRIKDRQVIVVEYLRQKLPGLTVADADLDSFAQAYVATIDPKDSRWAHFETIFFVMGNTALEAAMPDRLRFAYDWQTRNLLTKFLFSTNFFGPAGQRPDRTDYVALADPYALGCRNPLARFDT